MRTMKEKITITISKENWQRLCQLKIDLKLRKFDDVLERLFDK